MTIIFQTIQSLMLDIYELKRSQNLLTHECTEINREIIFYHILSGLIQQQCINTQKIT